MGIVGLSMLIWTVEVYRTIVKYGVIKLLVWMILCKKTFINWFYTWRRARCQYLKFNFYPCVLCAGHLKICLQLQCRSLDYLIAYLGPRMSSWSLILRPLLLFLQGQCWHYVTLSVLFSTYCCQTKHLQNTRPTFSLSERMLNMLMKRSKSSPPNPKLIYMFLWNVY